MKKLREDEDDGFRRLPDDVIFDIFSRVSDSSKFLTQCLLLSKQFASLIRHVSTVSVKIHLSFSGRNNGYCYNSVRLSCNFINPNYSQQDYAFKNCWKLNRWLFSFDELAHLYIDRAREELHQFSSIKSAIVDYPRYQITYHDTKMIKWLVEYKSNPGIVKSCAFLGLIDDDKKCREITKLGFCGLSDTNIYTWVASLFRTAFTLYPMVARMAQDHESLRDVLVTTGSRKGWIHAGEDEIVKMRQTGGSADELVRMTMMTKEIVMMVKVWYITVPVTLTESSVYVFAVFSSPDNIDRDVKAVTGKFWGDQCSYWAGNHDDEKIDMTEWVETTPCDLEFTWIASFEPIK